MQTRATILVTMAAMLTTALAGCTKARKITSPAAVGAAAPDLRAAEEMRAPLPAIEMKISGGEAGMQALSVTRADVEAQMVGLVAQVRMTMTFHNPHSRVLEGELVFPLPEDATVSGYALDIDGRMVDAVVIEKTKARVVFEKEVRKGVDPGIVEWVGGNSFRTRVYPIPAGGERTIAVEYVRNLALSTDAASLQLPLSFPAGLQKLGLAINVPNAKQAPAMSWHGLEALDMTFEADTLRGEARFDDVAIAGWAVASVSRRGRSTAVERMHDGSAHFVISEPVVDSGTSERRDIERVTLLWDASHSRRRADHLKALAAIGEFVEAVGKPITVTLVPFSNTQQTSIEVQVGPSNMTALSTAAADLAYDGGTQLAAISPRPSDRAPDLYLMVSDGMGNFGRSDPTGFEAPVHTITVSGQNNSAFLRWLAASTGGLSFDLTRDAPSRLREAASVDPLRITAIDVLEGELTDVLPRAGRAVGAQLLVTGKLVGERAKVKISLGRGSSVTETREFVLDAARPRIGTVVARIWAQQKVAELEAFPKKNSSAMVALGMKYNLVTPGTSMIVLESLDQYIEHRIRPPASLAEFRKAYDQHIGSERDEQKRTQQSKLEQMVSLWTQRIAWWNKKFPKTARAPDKKSKKSMAPSRSRRMRSGAPRSAPASAQRSAGGVAAEMAVSEEADDMAQDKEAKAEGSSGPRGPSIELKEWTPDTPYLRELQAAQASATYGLYLALKETWGGSPAFYLDCSDFFFKRDDSALGLRILSNVAELELEDAPLMRVLAHRLSQLGHLELARLLFERTLEWRPEEPQSYRDLALVLAREKQYGRAMALLSHVVMNTWDRFAQIELIALMELNAMIPEAKKAGFHDIPLDPRLIKLLDVDIRISLSWDADLTDIDMWVIEPTGEKAYYGNNLSHIGGLVSRDFTQGYGPEEYIIRQAMPGTYKVQANFYGSSAQKLTGAVTVQLDLYTNYGRVDQQQKSITLRLAERKETITVGTMTFE